MDKKMLGVGIRGTGQVAVQHIAAINSNPHLYVSSVCGRSTESTEKFAEKYAPGAKKFIHLDDMLNENSVDIVSICMPNYMHAAEAVSVLEAGKHLILEKPPAIEEEELSKLRETAGKSDRKSVVSFVLRWHPLISNLKSLIEGNAIGDIYHTETDYWHGIKPSFSSYNWIRKKEFAGGAVITGGSHAVDLARYLKGEITEVFAYSFGGREDFDYPTSYVVSVRFEDGSIGKVSASLDGTAFPYQFNINLLGTEGIIRNNRIYSGKLFPVQDDFIQLQCDTPDSGSVAHHPFSREIDNIVESIINDVPVLTDVADACKTMDVVLAINKSAETGKPVRINK